MGATHFKLFCLGLAVGLLSFHGQTEGQSMTFELSLTQDQQIILAQAIQPQKVHLVVPKNYFKPKPKVITSRQKTTRLGGHSPIDIDLSQALRVQTEQEIENDSLSEVDAFLLSEDGQKLFDNNRNADDLSLKGWQRSVASQRQEDID